MIPDRRARIARRRVSAHGPANRELPAARGWLTMVRMSLNLHGPAGSIRCRGEISRASGLGLAALLLGLAGCPAKPPQADTDDDAGTESGEAEAEAGSSSDTGAPDGAPEVCTRWVACSLVIDPATDMAGKYGADGSCWQGDPDERAACIAFCDGQLHMYAKAFPDEDACSVEGLPVLAEFRMGEAVFDPNDPLADPVFQELADGDVVEIVRGGQGLLMLPFAVRGRGFEVPPDPNAWDDPKMPHIDLWVDIEGHNIGFGGHFARLNAYPIGFVPIDDAGTLEHLYIAIIVPDAIEDPTTLTNQPGVLHAELQTYMQSTVIQEIDFVVAPEIQEM